MKIREVIDKILEFHPHLGDSYEGCDTYKCGDPDWECSGVATAMVPTVEVIKEAAACGCNLLVVHEPIYYTTPDFSDWKTDYENKVYQEKKELLEKYKMVVWRDHDHMHAHVPDCIFSGVEKYLGWEDYKIKEKNIPPFIHCYHLPKTSVGALAQQLKETIGLNGLRLVGNAKDEIEKVAIVGHLYPNSFMEDGFDEKGYWKEYGTEVIRVMEEGVDAIIPGEIIEWTVLSYVRDALMLGKRKAVLNIGHFAMEELGMKKAADDIAKLVGDSVKVTYIPSKDMYTFL